MPLARPLRLALPVLLLVLAALLVPPPTPVGSTPVCADLPRELCGGRVFPEPTESVFALTYAETVAGLGALAEEFPGWLDLEEIGTSVDGSAVLLAEVTDPDGEIPLEDRKVVFVSQSIHGNEPGGREGGVRYLEDLLRGDDAPRRALLDRVRVVQVFLNPDGWTAGDHDAVPDGDSVGLWVRGNGASELPVGVGDFGNVDLNRNAPWYGFSPDSRPDPASQPEMAALVAEVQDRLADGQDIQAATDIHGEVDNTAAWVMLSAGEFDLQEMTQQRRHGEAVVDAVGDALSEDQLVMLAELTGGLADGPAILTASSEFGSPGVGGSGTGFTGDWLAQEQGGDSASISTIELLNVGTPGVNSVTFNRPLFQVYRDTVAAILGALIDQAVVDHVPSVDLPGRVGYVLDPLTVREPEGVTDPLTGEGRTPEARSTMAFFDQLQPYVDQPLEPIATDELTAERLAGLDSLVITRQADPGTPLLSLEALPAIRDWVEGGGNLVLTDSALQLLPDITGAQAAVTADRSDINQVAFADERTGLLSGVRENAFLLVEPATLGYDSAGGSLTPAWRVASSDWEALEGATTAGTIGAGQTAVGQAPLGAGEVTVIGQLLPPPSVAEADRVFHGLESHGVLDTGYAIFLNALDAAVTVAQRNLFPAGPTDPTDPTDPTGPTDPGPGGGGTGGGGATPPPADDDTPTPPAEEQPQADDVARIAGGDRIATAIAASRDTFGIDEAGAVVLARADTFPDALTGGTLAAAEEAPLLLTPSDALPESVGAEVDRVLPDGGTVYVLGGQSAVAPAVLASLAIDGYDVVRIGGQTRFETAVQIAERVDPSPATVLLATGADFPDALAAGAAAVQAGGVVLLTDGERMPEETAARLGELPEAEVTAVGGGAAAAAPDAVAIVGADRFATAAMVADRFTPSPAAVGIATGADFPDALAGVAHLARRGGPILLSRPDDLPAATRTFLADRADVIGTAFLFGGEAALSAGVRAAVEDAIR